jgi:hypothetical protein
MGGPLHVVVLVASAALVACNEPSGHCEVVSRIRSTDPSAPLLIGGTLADVQTAVGGTHSGPLRWLESEGVAWGWPPPGETELTVTVQPLSAEELDREVVDAGRDERLACTDLLQMELEIELRTADGNIDTTILSTMTLESQDSMWIVHDLTHEDFGALRWGPLDDPAQLLLELVLHDATTAPHGSLKLFRPAEEEYFVELATWTQQ